MAAADAFDSQKTMFEPTAAQVLLELVAHERGQRGVALTEIPEKGLGVLLDDLVEQCVFRAVAHVALLRVGNAGAAPRFSTSTTSAR